MTARRGPGAGAAADGAHEEEDPMAADGGSRSEGQVGEASGGPGPAPAGPGGPAHGVEPSPERPGPLPVRLFRVFVAPGRLFAALRDDPRWAAAALLGAVVVAVSTLLIPGEIWDEMFRRQMLQTGQQLPEGFDFGTIQRVAAVIGGSLFWFLWTLLLAGVLSVVFAFVLGDDGRYRQYLSVTAHALLIPALGGLATVPLRVVRRDPQLTLNLGLFVDLEPGYLMNLLTVLDLFLLWGYVVMAVGVHEIDRRRSWGSATAVILGLGLVFAAGMAFLLPS